MFSCIARHHAIPPQGPELIGTEVTNRHPNLPWNFMTHGFQDPSAFPEPRIFCDSAETLMYCSKGVVYKLHARWFINRTPAEFVNLVTRIAATSNRKSLATAIAIQKNHCDSENTCRTAISLRFLQENLRLRNCDWQSLAICDCDCVGH